MFSGMMFVTLLCFRFLDYGGVYVFQVCFDLFVVYGGWDLN